MDLELFSFGPAGWGDELVAGLDLTLRLSLTAILGGSVLGLVLALGELSPLRLVGRLLEALNLVLRSVPELLVIFLIYYGAAIAIEAMLTPLGISAVVDLSRFWSAVLALGLILAHCILALALGLLPGLLSALSKCPIFGSAATRVAVGMRTAGECTGWTCPPLRIRLANEAQHENTGNECRPNSPP